MLSLRLIPKGLSSAFKHSTQQIHKSCLLLNKDDSSSSSSSDSSDSDSDKESEKSKKNLKASQVHKIADEKLKLPDTNERLNIILQNLIESAQKNEKNKDQENNSQEVLSRPNKTIEIAIKPKKIRFEKVRKIKQEVIAKEKPIEKQIEVAAKEVAETLKGDTQKTELELLSRILNVQSTNENEPEINEDKSLRSILSNMKVDNTPPDSNYLKSKQIVSKVVKHFTEPSVSESLLYSRTRSNKRKIRHSYEIVPELKVAVPPLGILNKFPTETLSKTIHLSTWETMELREIKLATLTTPQNVFQELIQWTEHGKLWKFPINNEQGMIEEEKVHFSEHIFVERHLKGWCPRRGPIKHFMELVCTGLSKNPYMTVEEKIEHITWYRDYFEDKRSLLLELGVLDDKADSIKSSEEKKQIQA